MRTTDAEQAYRAYRDAVAREQSLTWRAPDAELAAARRETLVRKAELAQARERAARERGSTAPTLTPDARRALVERLDRESERLRARQDAVDPGDLHERARLRRERQTVDRQRAELGRGLGPAGRSR